MFQKSMTSRFKGDIITWFVIFILCGYSALAVYSGIGKRYPDSAHLYLWRHLFIACIGLILMWGVHLVKWHNFLQKTGLAFLIISWILLIITIRFGVEKGGAKRWLDFGVFLVQTSDIAKVVLVVYLSSILANIKAYQSDFKRMLKWVYIPVCVTCALIAKEDNSTAMLLFAVVVLLMFFARISMKKIFTLIGICALGIASILLIFTIVGALSGEKSSKSGHRLDTGWSRITQWNSPKEPGSQEFTAKLAVAEGGIMGRKPGQSEQRFKLANVESDYIFALIVEEYGLLLGAIPIIIAFLILTFRGIKIALNSNRPFSAYLVLGITFMYVLQAFINIGVSVDCFPVTGQPMPFVSKGGSMFIMCCIAYGLVLSESRVNAEDKGEFRIKNGELRIENGEI
jgi:cell division protein FtsW